MPKSINSSSTTQRIAAIFGQKVLLFLIIIQICIGVVVVLTGQYYKFVLGRYLPAEEQSEIYLKLWLVQLHGVHIIASYGCGIPITRRFSIDTNNLKTLLNVWNICVLIVSFDGGFMHWMWRETCQNLERTVEQTLYKGLESYYADAEWRLLWDGFQYNEQCCGVAGFRDWQSWLNVAQSATQDYVQSDVDSFISLTPYSCCKLDANCYNGDYKTKRFTNVWMRIPSVNVTAINQDGCLKVFQHRIFVGQVALGTMAVMVFILQMLIFINVRYLLLYNRFTKLTATIDQHSQTDIAAGKPISASYFGTTAAASSSTSSLSTFNSVESIQLIYECEKDTTQPSAIDNMILQRKKHKQYTKVRDKRKQRVTYSDIVRDDENSGDDEYIARKPLLKRPR